MARKAAAGTGTIRKKVITRNGKKYEYWEARYTAGYDPGTGKQIQRSITGKTQKEVAQKLKAATAAIDDGSYQAPAKMKLGQWLDIWEAEYLGAVKPRTADSYRSILRNHIKPALGAVRLDALEPHILQTFYNSLTKPTCGGISLSAKTVRNIHGTLHKALQQAQENGYLRYNPSEHCKLPRAEKKEMLTLDDDRISAFLKAISGHRYEDVYIVTLFTGLRQGEACGLMWDCVDLDSGTILVKRQLQSPRKKGDPYTLATTKNGKGRSLTVAPFVVAALRRARRQQLENRLRYGECWENSGFVFTDDLGGHLKPKSIYQGFKHIAEEIGIPEARFHDLRHSYAVASLRSGDDIKTVQENLGHATAAFTLNTYAHVTEQMKRDSAERMEQFIKAVNK